MRPPPPKAECAATDQEDQTASGRIYSVPSTPKRSNVISADTPGRVSTNLKRDAGNSKDGLRDWIQLHAVNVLLMSIRGKLTSANTAPYLMTLSTALSVDPLMSGE